MENLVMKIWRSLKTSRSLLIATALVTVLLPGVCAAGTINLVTNGGFEAGNFSAWTLSGNTANSFVDTDLPHSGEYAADLGAIATMGFLSQTLATTPGQTYILSYWLQNDGGLPNGFQASWDDSVLTGSQLMDSPGTAYAEDAFDVTATTSSTRLTFGFVQTPAFWHLDDVSVTPAPEASPMLTTLLGLGWLGILRWKRRHRQHMSLVVCPMRRDCPE
jgi:MYXO-CTERM domain-containing protein